MESAIRLPPICRPKDTAGEGPWSSHLPVLASPTMVRTSPPHVRQNNNSGRRPRGAHQGSQHQPALAHGSRADRVKREWASGIRSAVLGLTGVSTNTGGAEEAARLLSELGWSDRTWTTRASQVAKWLRFCDEDMRCSWQAGEGDVLAYIGFLSIEGKVSPASLAQYLSAVSQYHELHHLPSPTKTSLVRALVRAYRHNADNTSDHVASVRIGCSASVMRQVVEFGIKTDDTINLACAAMTVMEFVFQVRSVSMGRVQCKDIIFDEHELTVSFFRRKGRSIRRPHTLRYPRSPEWPTDNPIGLIYRWYSTQSSPDSGFPCSLSESLQRVLSSVQAQPPQHCHFSAHSLRIGGYNELLVSGVPKEQIMARLEWETDAMLRVYHDSRIVATDSTRWFFAHL